MCILAFKIVFISVTRQEGILHKNVKEEKVLFKYYLQLLYLTFLCKIKSCQVIAENPPFYVYFGVKNRFYEFNRQESILYDNVKWEKVLFYYNLQLLYLTFSCKIKFCQVIAENRPFYVYFGVKNRFYEFNSSGINFT